MVFFAWNSEALAPEQREKLVRETAVEIKERRSRGLTIHGIVISGYADRSATVQRSMELSFRRAEAVRRELEKHGLLVAPTHIEAFGELRPLRETADGQREPLNRRVEVSLKASASK
jgi:outer membrane protein OmpA-like peptidoglycan-associated protein